MKNNLLLKNQRFRYVIDRNTSDDAWFALAESTIRGNMQKTFDGLTEKEKSLMLRVTHPDREARRRLVTQANQNWSKAELVIPSMISKMQECFEKRSPAYWISTSYDPDAGKFHYTVGSLPRIDARRKVYSAPAPVIDGHEKRLKLAIHRHVLDRLNDRVFNPKTRIAGSNAFKNVLLMSTQEVDVFDLYVTIPNCRLDRKQRNAAGFREPCHLYFYVGMLVVQPNSNYRGHVFCKTYLLPFSKTAHNGRHFLPRDTRITDMADYYADASLAFYVMNDQGNTRKIVQASEEVLEMIRGEDEERADGALQLARA